MKKKDTKPKPKSKPKVKVSKLKQKQKQSQSVIINISNGKAKGKTSQPKKPSYTQFPITTFPIFRDAPYQEPLYRNPEKPIAPFVDNNTLSREIPVPNTIGSAIKEEFTPIKIKEEVITPPRKTEAPSNTQKDMLDLYDALYTKKNLNTDFSPKPATRLPVRGRPKKVLNEEQKEAKRKEQNLKRVKAYALKKNEKSS